MPKPARQIPPVLELFRLGAGTYSMRITDIKDNYIAVKLAELLPDLRSLQVITPSDMKVFSFDGNIPEKINGAAEHVDDLNNVPDEEIPDPMEEAMKLAQAEEAPAAPADKRGRGRPRKVSSAERTEKCQRCLGSGKVQTMLDGGRPAETMCPLCQGDGNITRFGAQR